ncbi:MAG: bifunctional folylpolyglutamate synthase/dihydrofolate synthase, partial [Coprococcus sp.]
TADITFDRIIVTNAPSSRKASLDAIVSIFARMTDTVIEQYENIPEAMDRAMILKTENRNIYCVGSLYLVGGVKKWIEHRRLL